MFNYQDFYNFKKSEYFNSVANKEEANAVLEQEVKYLVRAEPWHYSADHLVEKEKLMTIFRDMKTAVVLNHMDLYKARIPWETLDRYYDKALQTVYSESQELDFNKVSGHYYEMVINHFS